MIFFVRRMSHAVVPWVLLIQLAGCGFGVSLKEPAEVRLQAQRSAFIRPGESTQESVRAALGEPWLQSRFWGFDVYRVNDTSTELGGLFVTILPIPIGVFTSQVEGYLLIAYDPMGRVDQVSSGNNTPGPLGEQHPLMLRARDLNLGIEKFSGRGTQLMADAKRLQDYLALRKHSNTCTVILACEETKPQKWPYEACPDRVVIDDDASIDPQPFFGSCDPASSCPPKILQAGQYMRVPMVHAISLPPGTHRLMMTSSTFKGQHETSFECAQGEVGYGIIRGHVNWDWWSPRTSTLNTSVTFEDDLPPQWASYSVLLYRQDHWLVQPEP
jgi:hypothetical protein